ncbi:MAG TPA: Ig-like domain-containing protein [Candidatus Acidoferrales bacterium]|nr:Ig-like domain-containing protein [Candidatus Acidoferrales bacterium]
MAGQYELPIHLEAGASWVIDMAQLIALNRPDSNGSVIPASAREGSVMFASTAGPHEPLSLVVSGGEYNVQTATCCPSCINCCGVVSFSVSPTQFTCPDGNTYQMYASGDLFNGTQQDVTSQSTWSSDNTSVATVSNPGGLMTAVGVGGADIQATFTSQQAGDPSCGVAPPTATHIAPFCAQHHPQNPGCQPEHPLHARRPGRHVLHPCVQFPPGNRRRFPSGSGGGRLQNQVA